LWLYYTHLASENSRIAPVLSATSLRAAGQLRWVL
jgi:hypothetical protein